MQVTLTQNFKSTAEGPGIEFVCSMVDGSNNSQEVGVNAGNNTVAFNGYGPSMATMSNISDPGNPPSKVTFDVAGTGNLPGKNNAAYTGSGSFTLSWSYNPILHRYDVHASNGTITLNY